VTSFCKGGLVDPQLRAFNKDLPATSIFLRGGSQAVLHCAHRATTALSWGLCEQEGQPGCSLLCFLLRPRAPGAQDRHGRPSNSSRSASTGDRPSHPPPLCQPRQPHSAWSANPMPEDLLCVKGEDVLHAGRASDHVTAPPHKRTPDLIPIRPNRIAIGHVLCQRRRPHSFSHLVLCRSIRSLDEIFPLRRETRAEHETQQGRYHEAAP
jgi:hypothetical protein